MGQTKYEFHYHFQYPVSEVYNIIMNEQLKFYQQYDSSIKELQKGQKIKKEMNTKTSQKPVKVKMIVNELIENKKIEVVTKYQQGDIVTTYEFMKDEKETEVVYREDNHFHKSTHELNFQIVGFLYHWIYKRQMKKRMKYIDDKLQKGELRID